MGANLEGLIDCRLEICREDAEFTMFLEIKFKSFIVRCTEQHGQTEH